MAWYDAVSSIATAVGTQVSNVWRTVNQPTITLPGTTGGQQGVVIGNTPYVPAGQTSGTNVPNVLLWGAVGVLVIVLFKVGR